LAAVFSHYTGQDYRFTTI